MTKKFHRCDENCKPHTDEKKVEKKETTSNVKRTPSPSRVKYIANVYDPNYSEIDDTIEDIKKISRLVSTNDYSTNNIYLILQDALKKILLAER